MRIRLWGPVELVGPDGHFVALGSAKRRIALAILALERSHVVSGDRLIDAMWEGDPPATAKAAMQGHIAQLRKALGSGVELVTRSPGYQLIADRSQVDLTRFDDLLAEARNASDERAVELLRTALELRRGSVLADVPAEWLRDMVVAEREEAEIAAVQQLADRLQRLGRVAEAVELLRGMVERHPLRESLVELLISGLHREGRQADALNLYHRTRGLLADELGVDPGAGLWQAYQWALTDSADRPHFSERHSKPAQLPRENRGFVGRDAEFAQLGGNGPDDQAIRVLTGPAGVGKTALALRWAHRMASAYPDGNLHVDLRGFESEPLDPATALTGLLRAVRAPENPLNADESAALYRSALVGRRMLIVLDNAHSAEQVRPLLPGTPGCAVLVVSRNRLDDLVVTEGAVAVPVAPLPRNDAIAVLGLLVGAPRWGTGSDAEVELVELCDRLPLALRIAAGRLVSHPQWTIETLVRELRDENRRLTALSLPTARLGVESALTASYRRLSPEAVRLARLLGEHPGTDIDQYAVAALAGTSVREARCDLDNLAELHLLHEVEPGRYRRGGLVRLHSATLAGGESTAETDLAQARLLDYYVHVADLCRRSVGGIGWPAPAVVAHPPAETPEPRSTEEALGWMAKEEVNLHAVLETASECGQFERAWRLAWCLEAFHFHRGDRADRFVVATTGLAAARELGDEQAESLFHVSIGMILVRSGMMEEALLRCEQAVLLASGERGSETVALLVLGNALHAAGRLEQAQSRLQEAGVTSRRAGNVVLQAYAANATAYLLRSRGDLEGAFRLARQALELVLHQPDSIVHTESLLTVGKALRWLDRVDEALPLLRRGLALAQDMGDAHRQAQFHREINSVLGPDGETAPARQERAEALFTTLGVSAPDELRAKRGASARNN